MSQRVRMLTIGIIVFILVSIITTATSIYYYSEYLSANGEYEEDKDGKLIAKRSTLTKLNQTFGKLFGQ